MSPTKFEFLPPEVILMILEDYLDMNDVLNLRNIENVHLRRLVDRCQYFSLDLFACSRSYFQNYLPRLQQYSNKIRKLKISDQYAPQQTTLFAEAFPSFIPFSKLNQFDISIDLSVFESSIHQNNVNRLIESTNELKSLESVSVKLFNATALEVPQSLKEIWFRCSSLKRLSLNFDFILDDLSVLENVSTNLQYLSITGFCFPFVRFGHLLRSSPLLRYLNVEVASTTNDLTLDHVRQHENLRTLKLSFNFSHEQLLTQLTQLLISLIDLRRLTVRGNRCLMDAEHWQKFFNENHRNFEKFQLDWSADEQTYEKINRVMDSFETEFWRTMENFYLTYRKTGTQIISAEIYQMFRKEFLYRCASVPLRCRIDDEPFKFIRYLSVTKILSRQDYHKFENVHSLIAIDLNEEILKWLKEHLNRENIRELDLSQAVTERQHLIAFLELFPSVESIVLDSLRNYELDEIFVGLFPNVRFLTIIDPANVNSRTLSSLFPKLQHLIVNSRTFRDAPPNTRSITVCDTWGNPHHGFGRVLMHNRRRRVLGSFETIWLN